ncbi:MAG: DNA polymerase III subunit gamma/tau [Patescibacteria group bacterium]
MFYLKYRPHTIAELDNTAVKETISNVLRSPNLPHAYLFIGQKGMGKTSTARIVAKAVNCEKNKYSGVGTSIEPCNTCANCKAIDAGYSPDVIEQDAASNRGIDEIRNLIRESAFAPMTGRFRVFIIDEAHMITNDAFNALLKTLEEPPKQVLFILATTNEEKIPKTIASRAMRINFGKARLTDIVSMLQRIAKGEKINASDELLTFIAERADYSFRDATRMLEEVTMQNKLSVEEARAYLGVTSKNNFLELLANKSSLHEALPWIQQFTESGGSIKLFLEDLLHMLELQLMHKSGVVQEGVEDVPLSIKEIALLMKLLNEAYASLRNSPIEAVPLEIAVVEFYNMRT